MDVDTNIDEKYGRSEAGRMSASGVGALIQMKITGRGRNEHLNLLPQPFYAVITADKQ